MDQEITFPISQQFRKIGDLLKNWQFDYFYRSNIPNHGSMNFSLNDIEEFIHPLQNSSSWIPVHSLLGDFFAVGNGNFRRSFGFGHVLWIDTPELFLKISKGKSKILLIQDAFVDKNKRTVIPAYSLQSRYLGREYVIAPEKLFANETITDNISIPLIREKL